MKRDLNPATVRNAASAEAQLEEIVVSSMRRSTDLQRVTATVLVIRPP